MANECVWNFFYNIYGGGPSIVRKEKDIYSDQTLIQVFDVPSVKLQKKESLIVEKEKLVNRDRSIDILQKNNRGVELK